MTLEHEPLIRAACYFGSLLLLAGCEFILPRRPHTLPRRSRWPANIGIAVVGTVLVRLVLQAGTVGFAVSIEKKDWGLFPWLGLPAPLNAFLSVICLDLVIYAQHWLFHYQPLLWRLHRMHHADLDVDVTTGARFHPVEILLSVVIKCGAIAVLGVSALGALLFEVLLNVTSMFNHSNVRIPKLLEPLLRAIIVTPDMHRVHHSILREETNSNFGFNLSIWDRLFRTYRSEPAAGHDGITLGIEQFRDPRELRLHRMLLQPFRSDPPPQ
jgi:sterol desaturase/sphingolipid hydroxylase (fatty acid hydroxylase superfamily)